MARARFAGSGSKDPMMAPAVATLSLVACLTTCRPASECTVSKVPMGDADARVEDVDTCPRTVDGMVSMLGLVPVAREDAFEAPVASADASSVVGSERLSRVEADEAVHDHLTHLWIVQQRLDFGVRQMGGDKGLSELQLAQGRVLDRTRADELLDASAQPIVRPELASMLLSNAQVRCIVRRL